MGVVRINEERSKKNMENIMQKENTDKVTNIGTARNIPKTLNEALSKFQDLHISAVKNATNDFFTKGGKGGGYSDLTSVINAVNHGAQFGLSFTQSVNYDNIRRDVKTTRTDKQGNTVESVTTVHDKDIFVITTISHEIDDKTISCRVPVLINSNDKDNPHKMGSGITYAKRYGLQSLYGLASDDDGNEASKNNQGKVPNAINNPEDNQGGAF